MAKLKLEPGEYEQMKAKAERLRVELQGLGDELRRWGENGADAPSE